MGFYLSTSRFSAPLCLWAVLCVEWDAFPPPILSSSSQTPASLSLADSPPPPPPPQQTRFSECASCTRSFLSPCRCQTGSVHCASAFPYMCTHIYQYTSCRQRGQRGAGRRRPVTSAEPEAEAGKRQRVLKGQKRVQETWWKDDIKMVLKKKRSKLTIE